MPTTPREVPDLDQLLSQQDRNARALGGKSPLPEVPGSFNYDAIPREIAKEPRKLGVRDEIHALVLGEARSDPGAQVIER
ncbi:hypothetical protein AB0H34_05335 [Saccharopolyspora shandongensis]|uniref:hypothetical protein n=1 Tax=Saccharopolyspora shandongensis TaxID=418495 RepID=UPI0034039308